MTALYRQRLNMNAGLSSRHRIGHLGRLALGLTIGMALGAGIWAAAMAWQGHNLASAIHGEVEDGLSLLQAVVALGGMCGTGVGLCWGVVALNRNQDK
jgi:hypothetical protein